MRSARRHGLSRHESILVWHPAPDARNYGMEVNNQINEIVTTNLLTSRRISKSITPRLLARTANLNVTGGRNAGIILRPYVAMVYNSISPDFNERGIELDVRQGRRCGSFRHQQLHPVP